MRARHKKWDEVSIGDVPHASFESVIGFRPIAENEEGLAFWVKTRNNRYALVRIKSVQAATFSELASGSTAVVELEWAWGIPGKGTK